jgi:hypothetical protein
MSATSFIDDSPLQFGKYIGQTPNQIAEHSPGYIRWLYETIPGNVSRELYLACEGEEDLDGDGCFDDEERDDYRINPLDFGDR